MYIKQAILCCKKEVRKKGKKGGDWREIEESKKRGKERKRMG
jgi:hypothetical protein